MAVSGRLNPWSAAYAKLARPPPCDASSRVSMLRAALTPAAAKRAPPCVVVHQSVRHCNAHREGELIQKFRILQVFLVFSLMQILYICYVQSRDRKIAGNWRTFPAMKFLIKYNIGNTELLGIFVTQPHIATATRPSGTCFTPFSGMVSIIRSTISWSLDTSYRTGCGKTGALRLWGMLGHCGCSTIT